MQANTTDVLKEGVTTVLRTSSSVIALNAMVAALSTTVQAADQTLTLACQGTVTDAVQTDAKPEPVSMGIIVNFTARTVQGFGSPGYKDFPVKITGMNDVTLVFSGSDPKTPTQVTDWGSNGSIDRVTGDVEASSTVFEPENAQHHIIDDILG